MKIIINCSSMRYPTSKTAANASNGFNSILVMYKVVICTPTVSLRQNTREEHDSMEEQKSGSAFESSKTLDIHIGYPSLKRILVAYDGMEMSKRALSYAAYFSKKSDSEIVLVNVVKANADLNKVLPLTIKANLEGKEEQQLPMAGSQRQVLLNEDLRGVVEEMTTACGAATLAKKIIYEIRTGNPANEIINVSRLMPFDLIIMGSRRIASRIEVIGSTTRKVLTKVKIPILIVQKPLTYKDEY